MTRARRTLQEQYREASRMRHGSDRWHFWRSETIDRFNPRRLK